MKHYRYKRKSGTHSLIKCKKKKRSMPDDGQQICSLCGGEIDKD